MSARQPPLVVHLNLKIMASNFISGLLAAAEVVISTVTGSESAKCAVENDNSRYCQQMEEISSACTASDVKETKSDSPEVKVK
jgi:hypothetical protein